MGLYPSKILSVLVPVALSRSDRCLSQPISSEFVSEADRQRWLQLAEGFPMEQSLGHAVGGTGRRFGSREAYRLHELSHIQSRRKSRGSASHASADLRVAVFIAMPGRRDTERGTGSAGGLSHEDRNSATPTGELCIGIAEVSC